VGSTELQAAAHEDQIVDLSFPLIGQQIMRDHGYPLYGAICRYKPDWHGASWLGIHPVSRVASVTEHSLILGNNARLCIRLPAERISEAIHLAGRQIVVGADYLQLGAPDILALTSSPALSARIVFIKLTDAPMHDNAAVKARLQSALETQLLKLEIDGHAEIQGQRRINVAGKTLLGSAVRVHGLSVQGSIALQECGLGGKRAMGCGIFLPTRTQD
jgi:CRISPR-associated protein Cas6